RPPQVLPGVAANLPPGGSQPADTSVIAYAKQALSIGERLIVNVQPAQETIKGQRLDEPQPAAAWPFTIEPAGPGRGQRAEFRGSDRGLRLGLTGAALCTQGHEIG